MDKEVKRVMNLYTQLGGTLIQEMDDIVKGKNGICKVCNNKTCKRNKETNRKECNIFIEEVKE